MLTRLSFSFILFGNSIESIDFCCECPFNLQNSYINNIYDNYINNNVKEKKLKEHYFFIEININIKNLLILDLSINYNKNNYN